MAVVPDRRIAITHKLKMLKTNKAIVTAALEKLLTTTPAVGESTSEMQEKKPNEGSPETHTDTTVEQKQTEDVTSLQNVILDKP